MATRVVAPMGCRLHRDNDRDALYLRNALVVETHPDTCAEDSAAVTTGAIFRSKRLFSNGFSVSPSRRGPGCQLQSRNE
jgi:hypothetical protein